MALPGATNQYADVENKAGFIKRIYAKAIKDQEKLKPGILGSIPKSPVKPHGTSTGTIGGYWFPIRTDGNWSIRSGTQTGATPDPYSESGQQCVVYPLQFYGAIQLTCLVMDTMEATGGSWIGSLKDEMAKVGERLLAIFNYNVWLNGYGVLGSITSVSASATVTDAIFVMAAPDYGMRLRSGMHIDVKDPSLTTNPHAHCVDGIVVGYNRAAHTVTLRYAAQANRDNVVSNVAALDEMVLHSDRDSVANPWFNGFINSFDDGTDHGTYLGITRATTPVFVGNLFDNSDSTRDLSEDLMQEMVDIRDTMTDDPKKSDLKFWSNQGQRRKFLEIVRPARRYSSGDFKAGHTTIDFNGIPYEVDVDAPRTRLFSIDLSTYALYELTAPTWGNAAGRLFETAGYDMVQSYLRCYRNYACNQPNVNSIASYLNEP